MDYQRGLAALLAFALGACVGSFVNVVAYRLPREISIVLPRSFCPQCRRTIPFWANVPLLAYLGLRARCFMCGASIPFRYFLTEMALGAAAAYLFLDFAPLDALARFVLCAALFAVALIDYDWRVIPSAITLAGIPLGLVAAALVMPEIGWRSSLLGIVLGAGFLFAVGAAYMLVRGVEGVGLGDIWLVGMAGAFLGWAGAFFTLFAGSLMGTIGGIVIAFGGWPQATPEEPVPMAIAPITGPAGEDRGETGSLLRTTIPFGPFLALAAAIFALFQPQLVHWYLAH